MILKGKQRANGKQLGIYLLKINQNEHVEIHELRGFVANDLPSALSEIDAISKGTRATQPFFSLSLNPPSAEEVPIEAFDEAIEQVERKLGLDDQPRAIVFHEKEGRRHAHVVWSRIDTGEMKAINLPHYKVKLRDVSRNLYLEHGWKMPPGLMDRRNRNPLNFSREEWQQSRRAGLHPKAVKRAFQESWAASDSRKAFAQALLSKGFVLARGDRRGYVALDYRGEVYAVAKYAGMKTKDVRKRLGDPKDLPSIEQAKGQISADMTERLRQHLAHAEKTKQRRSAALEFKRQSLIDKQRKQRRDLEETQRKRWDAETKARAQRLSHGLLGIWHRLTGKHEKVQRQNEMETLVAYQRDRAEKDALIFKHIQQRQNLSLRQRSEIHTHALEIELLRQDIKDYRDLETDKHSRLREEYREALETPERPRRARQEQDHEQDYDHEPEM